MRVARGLLRHCRNRGSVAEPRQEARSLGRPQSPAGQETVQTITLAVFNGTAAPVIKSNSFANVTNYAKEKREEAK